MDEGKEYLTTERMGAYYPEKAVVKKSENGVTRALYRDSCYTIDDVNYTRERIMIIKGKRFIISSVFPVESTLTATDKMLELIDADMNKKMNVIRFFTSFRWTSTSRCDMLCVPYRLALHNKEDA